VNQNKRSKHMKKSHGVFYNYVVGLSKRF